MSKLLSLLVVVSALICISECQRQQAYYYQARPTLVHFPTQARTSTIRFPQRQQQLRAALPNEYNSYGFESPNSINYDRQQRVINSNALGNHNNFVAQPASNKDCVCPCTREYLPICASDRKSYGNRCLFECEQKCNPGLRFRHCGTCEEPDSNQSCL